MWSQCRDWHTRCTNDSVRIELSSRRGLQTRFVEPLDLTPDDLDFTGAQGFQETAAWRKSPKTTLI